MKPRRTPRAMRRIFVNGLFLELRVVWPVLSALLGAIAALGLATGMREDWTVQESLYFAFVSGLTIGYGDFSPRSFIGRMLAIAIGFCGILLTALVAAVAVQALNADRADNDGDDV